MKQLSFHIYPVYCKEEFLRKNELTECLFFDWKTHIDVYIIWESISDFEKETFIKAIEKGCLPTSLSRIDSKIAA